MDIYCEKPLSLTIREARAMVTATRRYGRVFQTGSQQRSSREFRFACEMVRSGRIGKLVTISVNVGGPSEDCYLPEEPVPAGVDWDLWLGPAPWRPYHSILCPPPSFTGFPYWRRYRDYSGGGMTDWGAHHFDIAQWGMGTDDSGPVEIIPPDGKDVKFLTYKYASGVTIQHNAGGNGVLFHGTEGKIEVNRGHLQTWPDNLMHKPTGPGEVHLYTSTDHRGNWLDCIRSRQRPICDVEIGRPLGERLPLGQPRLLAQAAVEMGSGQRAVRRRCRGQSLDRSTVSRSVDAHSLNDIGFQEGRDSC